jgi:hypothetical protein
MKPETRLDIAKRLIIEAEGLVARQHELISVLDNKGHRIEQAQHLLGNLEAALVKFRRTLARLQSSKS